MNRSIASWDAARVGMSRLLVPVGLSILIAACEEPLPRTFTDFMDDRVAREGIIAQCNLDPVLARNNIECANARRAAAAIALRMERDRVDELERESERKLEALRREMAERERLVRDAALAAARAEREAYEARWREDGTLVSQPEARQSERSSPGSPAPE